MLINDSTSNDVLFDPRFGRGCIPPDYKLHPEATPLRKVSPSEIKLIPRSEWSARIKEKAALKSRLSDIRRTSGPNGGPIPSLQQNSGRNDGRWGYCWAHSATHAHMLLRAAMGQPYQQLSAFAVAAIIKGGRNEGGWGALSLDWIEKNGQPTTREWPQNSVDLSLDTPAMRAVAAKYKITADWADLTASMWDRSMSFDHVATLLLSNVPVIDDANWWSHSFVLMDLVEIEAGSFGVKGWNSWGDEWGDLGEFTLQGNKAIPDGAVAPMSVTAV